MTYRFENFDTFVDVLHLIFTVMCAQFCWAAIFAGRRREITARSRQHDKGRDECKKSIEIALVAHDLFRSCQILAMLNQSGNASVFKVFETLNRSSLPHTTPLHLLVGIAGDAVNWKRVRNEVIISSIVNLVA